MKSLEGIFSVRAGCGEAGGDIMRWAWVWHHRRLGEIGARGVSRLPVSATVYRAIAPHL